MYMILAVMMLQWHFIGQINNIMCLATTTIQQKLHHLFCLQLKTENVQVQKYQIISKQQGWGSLEPTASTRALQPTQAGLAF